MAKKNKGGEFDIHVLVRENMTSNYLAEAEWDLGNGIKIVGFTIWKGKNGHGFVTFPSRSFGSGVSRKFFDFVRASGTDKDAIKRLKDGVTHVTPPNQEAEAS